MDLNDWHSIYKIETLNPEDIVRIGWVSSGNIVLPNIHRIALCINLTIWF